MPTRVNEKFVQQKLCWAENREQNATQTASQNIVQNSNGVIDNFF